MFKGFINVTRSEKKKKFKLILQKDLYMNLKKWKYR